MQTQHQYIRDWIPRREKYIKIIIGSEGPPTSCTSCNGDDAQWRCRDCYGKPVFCSECCKREHRRNPYHRVQYWNGKYYEASWLLHTGLVMGLGHGGDICPVAMSRVTELDHTAAGIEEDEGDVIEDIGEVIEDDDEAWITENNDDTNQPNVPTGSTPEDPFVESTTHRRRGSGIQLKDYAKIYDAPAGCNTLATTIGKSMTIVDSSGVHLIRVVFCECRGEELKKEKHLLEAGLFPTSYKIFRTAFTFSVLDDFRTANLDCKTSAYHYFRKLRRLTCPGFPDAVTVCEVSPG